MAEVRSVTIERGGQVYVVEINAGGPTAVFRQAPAGWRTQLDIHGPTARKVIRLATKVETWEGWTDDTVERAKAEYRIGRSAGEIAKMIGAPSRNAVIGKLSRLSLFKRELPQNPKLVNAVDREAVLQPFARTKRAPMLEMMPRKPPLPMYGPRDRLATVGRSLMSRRFTECSWIVAGDGAESLMCCARVVSGSWCAGHAKIGISEAPRKRLRAA